MLTAKQIAHFETFGFLLLRQLFSSAEMDGITREAEALWQEDLESRPDTTRHQVLSLFVEKGPLLAICLSTITEGQPIHGKVPQLVTDVFLSKVSLNRIVSCETTPIVARRNSISMRVTTTA